jgi:hypothetical protein
MEIGKKMGYDEGLAEGMRRATEEAKKMRNTTVMVSTQKEKLPRENIVVKLPPATLTVAKKDNKSMENIKPEPTPKHTPTPKLTPKPKLTNGDPFASLVGLVRIR